MKTLEEKRAANKIARDKYRASPKFKAWLAKYQSIPEVKEANLKSVKRWQAKPGVKERLAPGKRRSNLKDKYGITLEDYEKLFLAQNGVCAICGEASKSGKKLAVDHNHDTGKVRGLLCAECNLSLGLLKENPERMIKMAEYIRNSK